MNEKTAYYEIDCDGYYPYCDNCRCEPDPKYYLETKQLPEYCPRCGAKMLNYDDISKRRPNKNG